MKVSELVDRLQKLIERHGDLEVVGYFDSGQGSSSIATYWFEDKSDGQHIALELNEGMEPMWRYRLPEDKWPPEDERGWE